MKKKDSNDDWQERFIRMEEDLRNAKEERDALRAVMKGEVSPDALSSIDGVPDAKAPMRLMSGEEYRNWVQESVSRRLMGIFSAIGIGGVLALAGLGRIYVNSMVSGVEDKVAIRLRADMEKELDTKITIAQGIMNTKVRDNIQSSISEEILKKSNITKELQTQAFKQQKEISEVLRGVVNEEAQTAVEEMIAEVASSQKTIDTVTAAISQKGDLDGVVLGQLVGTFNDPNSDDELKAQALQMLSVFGGDKQLKDIQKQVLLESETKVSVNVQKEVLKVFRPWLNAAEDGVIRNRMLAEFSSDPDCDVRHLDPELFDARQHFLKTLGPSHAEPMTTYVFGKNSEHPPYCLVAHALADMPDDAGIAMKQLVRMAKEGEPRAKKAAWKSLKEVANVPEQTARHDALRAAWDLLGNVASLTEFEDSEDFKVWLTQKREDSENVANAYKMFSQILEPADWETLIAAAKDPFWPNTEADAEATESGGFSRAASGEQITQGLQHQVLAALTVNCVKSDDDRQALIDNLIQHSLTDSAYLSKKGLCRILTQAMEYASADTLINFMADISDRLAEAPVAKDYSNSDEHKQTLLVAALKRDAELSENQYKAAILLIENVRKKTNAQALLAQLYPAFRKAADNDSKVLVRQTKEHLEVKGVEGKGRRSYGLEISRLLASRGDSELIKAIENENLVASIVEIENEESDLDLQRLGTEVRKQLFARLKWVGNILETQALVPGETLSGLKAEESWFRIRLQADTAYRINLVGGPAELTLIGANQIKVLHRHQFEPGHPDYSLPTGQLGGERYLRLRPQKSKKARANSSWTIQTHKVNRLSMSPTQIDAALIPPGNYADHIRKTNWQGEWFQFEGKEGCRYVAEIAGDADTNIRLYNKEGMLLRKDDDGGAGKIKWYSDKDTNLFGQISTTKKPEEAIPFQFSLKEFRENNWLTREVKIAGKSSDTAPRITGDDFSKGLVVNIPATDKAKLTPGFLKVPAKRGQIVEIQSLWPVYLSGEKSGDFPRLSVTESDTLERSLWWITEESDHVTLLSAGNLLLKSSVVPSAAEFTKQALAIDAQSFSIAGDPKFISQPVTEGSWYLPIQGEAGKQIRFSFLGEEKSGFKMAILGTDIDTQPNDDESWIPTKEDLIWKPSQDGIYYLRLTVTDGPTHFLFRAEAEVSNHSTDFKGLKAGSRVVLGDVEDKYFNPELSGTQAIVLRLKQSPEGDVAILDTGYGSTGKRQRFLWMVKNLEPALKVIQK